ncbi:hypothetical protein, partial [Methylophaga sp. UBA3996]|uniref:hypothetical protein n=2 Tax=Methylophaga TaxID=40222 RepID=UPI0025A2D667
YSEGLTMTTNQDKTIYVTGDNQEFVPEIGKECFVVWFDRRNEKITPSYVGKQSMVFTDEQGDERCVYLSNIIEFQPLKTEAEIRREKAIESLTADICNMSDMYLVPPGLLAERLAKEGYIKPREITTEATNNAAESFVKEKVGDVMDLMSLLSFAEGARWAEKHIKGEA